MMPLIIMFPTKYEEQSTKVRGDGLALYRTSTLSAWHLSFGCLIQFLCELLGNFLLLHFPDEAVNQLKGR